MTVTNPYYEFTPSFVPGETVRSTAVNTQYQAIQNAFDFLPGDSDALTTGTATFAPESGSVNAYVVTMPDTRTVNQDGDEIIFFATHANTGAATLNVDSIGAIALVDRTGAALVVNDIISGRLYIATYDAVNTQFVLDVTTNVVTNILDTVQGSSTDDITSGAGVFNANLAYENALAVALGNVGFAGAGGRDFVIRNRVWEGRVFVDYTTSAGQLESAIVLDPDALTQIFAQTNMELYVNSVELAILGNANGSVDSYYDNVAVAKTKTALTGGLEANNTQTGAGFERVLTVSDVGITATTTELEQDTDPINTDPAKVEGYQVFNTTTNIPVWAAGPADVDVWVNATGATAHTPI